MTREIFRWLLVLLLCGNLVAIILHYSIANRAFARLEKIMWVILNELRNVPEVKP